LVLVAPAAPKSNDADDPLGVANVNGSLTPDPGGIGTVSPNDTAGLNVGGLGRSEKRVKRE